MEEQASKKQILKSTGIVGGAQVATVIAGIIRTKATAIFLGVSGVGLAGLFQATIDIIRGISTFGIPFSSVREISRCSHKDIRLFAVVWVMRKLVLITGIAATLFGILFSKQLSIYTFGKPDYWLEIALCSFALLAYALSAGQLALLQGLRRLGDMTRASVFSLFISTIFTVVIYYFFGADGIVPVIIGTAYIYLLFSWLFSRKVTLVSSRVDFKQSVKITKSLFGLGVISLIAGTVELLTMYLTRTFIYSNGGVEQVGIFTAAWSISTLYLSMVLNAMGADFYPRLSSEHEDHLKMVSTIRHQTEIAILIGMPVITGMLFFSDWVIQLLYSRKFMETQTILRWQFLGDFFKIISWPLGFVLLAKGKNILFMATNLLWSLIYMSIIYLSWPYLHVEIAGIAFFASYFVYFLVVYFLAQHIIDFTFSKKLIRIICLYIIALTSSFLLYYWFDTFTYHLTGVIIVLILLLISYKEISSIINIGRIIDFLKRKGRG